MRLRMPRARTVILIEFALNIALLLLCLVIGTAIIIASTKICP